MLVQSYNDVTILIPLRVDSDERKKNLDTQLLFLTKNFDCKIIILEADTKKRYKVADSLAAENISYYFIQDEDPIFYRTYYLNCLIKMADTPIIGIWDTDIFFTSFQWEKAVEKIRDKNASISIPYDGRAYSVDAENSSLFLASMDMDSLLPIMEEKNLMCGYGSVGGALFLDKEQYIEAGGENEYFYGWGPEDMERVKRLQILGHPISQTDGPLFHLYHPRGINSYFSSEESERRGQKEYNYIARQERSQLLEYIKQWDYPIKRFEKISNYLLLNARFNSDPGLYYGKAGIAIFFFHYSLFTGENRFKEYGFDLLEDIYHMLDEDPSIHFEKGLCGIGWAFEYLAEKGFIEENTSDLLHAFDMKIMERDPSRITDISLENGLQGILHYVMLRIHNSHTKNYPLYLENTYLSALEGQMIRLYDKNIFPEEARGISERIINQSYAYNSSDLLKKILYRIPLWHESEKWEMGLSNGCSGYILKYILS